MTEGNSQSIGLRLLREPLVHFVLAALAVFVAWNVTSGMRERADRTIVVTRTDIERFAALYAAESGALPSEADMAAIVNDYVRDEALAREARRLGLDSGDTIVTRRLAQKMTFMVSDLNEDLEPDDRVLRNWYEAHPERFTEPQEITFTHVYFSKDTRGENATRDAEEALSALNGGADWRQTGDPFMLQRAYGDMPVREIARLFGIEFARSVAGMDASDDWQGPVSSALGVHLVKVSQNTPAQLRPFDEARTAIIADWRDETRRTENEAAIRDIVSRYKVEVEGGDAN